MGFNVQAAVLTLSYCASLVFCLFSLISADWIGGELLGIGLFRTCATIYTGSVCEYGKLF